MINFPQFFRRFLFLLSLVFSITACDNSPKDEVKTLVGEALGTSYQIKYFSENEIELEKSLDSIFNHINTSMSTYWSTSDISKINKGDTTVRVDKDFRKVFQLSQKIHQESNGYFDPTVGMLVNAYGFGPEKQLKELDVEVLDSLMEFVGLDKMRLSDKGRLLKDDDRIYLDFNAIAKGYTVDVIANLLDEKGVRNYLVELGGELVAKGINLEKAGPWLVAIDDPMQDARKRDLQTVLALENRALATSGNYRKFRLDSTSGAKYVHTINPITGLAERTNLLSSSVLAENCGLADGYATAFMALGYENAKEMLGQLNNVDVYFVYAAEDGEVKVYATDGFKQVLRE